MLMTMKLGLLILSVNSCTQHITENVTKKGYHIDAMPVWVTVADSTIVHDKINIYIQLDSSTIKQIP
jgi:hypothetical protein